MEYQEEFATDEPRKTSLDLDTELVENIDALAAAGERGMVLNILSDLHHADIAQIISHIEDDNARTVLNWLPVELAGELLTELDDDYRANLLESTPDSKLAAMLDELETDDAADVLLDLPSHVAERILPELVDAADVQELIGYEEESAGGIMATEFVAIQEDRTVAEATEVVRENAETVEEIYVVFVVDRDEKLTGFVSLKRLLLSNADQLLSEIMNEDVISVQTDVDQEDVARLMEKYDLISLPVVDFDGRLVGRITIDDIVDVIREEAEEDIQYMSGVAGGEEPTDTVVRIMRGRLPWLLAGLGGATLAAFVIWTFQASLQSASILATFIPIVMATAGNAGIQSSAIAVQGLASGDVWASDIRRRLSKELLVALLNGVSAAIVLVVFILAVGTLSSDSVPNIAGLATTAGIALVIVIVMATSIGATVPLLLHKADIDPALATGPFITASNDILGILVFFVLANWLYL
jgi:magnesium transporter